MDPKVNGYQGALASMVRKFFDKRAKEIGLNLLKNSQLAEELHKPIIKNFEKKSLFFI